MINEAHHSLEMAYTAKQLIEKLQSMDPDARVLFVCSYGDYHNTQQALPVEEVFDADSSSLAETSYSQSGVQLVEDENDLEERAGEDRLPVVILR